MQLQRRVVVTGLGAVTPLGGSVTSFWKNLIDGQSAITALHGKEYASLPCRVAAQIPDEYIHLQKNLPRHISLGLQAAKEAMAEAKYKISTEEQSLRAGVCFGTGIGSLDTLYDAIISFHEKGYRSVSPFFVPNLLPNMLAGHISIQHNLKGPNHSVSTACTTGAHSIGDAYNFIRHNKADLMVCGGAEASIHPLAIAGFAKARSLSTSYNDAPEKASRPFDKERDGFVIGEGAGALVLEELEHAKARKADILAEIVGYGLSSDAHHISAPPDDGNGAYLCMQRALLDAQISVHNVDHINAHATSTRLGDIAELRAVQKLTSHQKMASAINITSIKGAIGHLLGAAGSVEAIASVLAIKTNTLPPTINLDTPDIPENNDSQNSIKFNFANKGAEEHEIDVSLTNSYGFGGTNASLAFRRFT